MDKGIMSVPLAQSVRRVGGMDEGAKEIDVQTWGCLLCLDALIQYAVNRNKQL